MLRKFLFFIGLIVVWSAFANPISIPVDSIKMIKEHVIIKGHQITGKNIQGEWRVHCEYVFTNTSNKAIDVKMAFPFPINHNFKVTAAGKSLPVTRIKLNSLPKNGLGYKNAYAWNMKFKPNETIILHHDYLTGVTVNSVVQNRIYYVLKTGKLWQEGKISHALLEVVPNTPTRLCSDSDNAEYLKPKPAGMKVLGGGKDKKYVWNLKNFSPDSDLELCLLTQAPPV